MTTTDPTTVTRDQVRAALDALGVGDHDDVNRVEITSGAVQVTRFRRDADGCVFAAGDHVAKTTTDIGVTEGDPQ